MGGFRTVLKIWLMAKITIAAEPNRTWVPSALGVFAFSKNSHISTTDVLFRNLLGDAQARSNVSPKSGWKKSPSRELFFDLVDIIKGARQQNADGQQETVLTVDGLKRGIVKGLTEHIEEGDQAIIWNTTKWRMLDTLGTAQKFVLVDNNLTVPETGDQSVPVTQPSIYTKYHLNSEEKSVIANLTRRDDFMQHITSAKSTSNCIGQIFFTRLAFHSLEMHLRADKPFETFCLESSICHIDVFQATGHNFTALLDGEDKISEFVKNWTKNNFNKYTNAKEKLFWKSANIKERTKVFQNVDTQSWNRMLDGKGWPADGSYIINLWDDKDNMDQCVHKNEWTEAAVLFRSGIVTKNFMSKVVKLRLLWMMAKKLFFFEQDAHTVAAKLNKLATYQRQLEPFILKKQKGKKHTRRTTTEFFQYIFCVKPQKQIVDREQEREIVDLT
jgi:hypothetical protein